MGRKGLNGESGGDECSRLCVKTQLKPDYLFRFELKKNKYIQFTSSKDAPAVRLYTMLKVWFLKHRSKSGWRYCGKTILENEQDRIWIADHINHFDQTKNWWIIL
jgi:hypothetical protein